LSFRTSVLYSTLKRISLYSEKGKNCKTTMKPKGILIYGRIATGKTTLELNLRRAVCGEYSVTQDYQLCNGVCFIGPTAKRGKRRILSTCGAEILRHLDDIPKAQIYIASNAPNFDSKTIRFFRELCVDPESVLVVSLFSRNRARYFENRKKLFFKRRLKNVRHKIGSAEPAYLSFGKSISFTTERLEQAYLFILNLLGCESKYPFDSKILFKEIQ